MRFLHLICICRHTYSCCIIDYDKEEYFHHLCLQYTGCAKKKKDILNIPIKSDGMNIFSQKFCWTDSTIFVVKCQKFTFIVLIFMT